MFVIKFRFLTGRYHATPWDRQVNEGAIEWPPSPWRIYRALLACWHLKGGDIEEAQMRALIEQLVSVQPHYHIPDGVVAHTRHYMPLGALDGKTSQDKTTKILDAFLHVKREEGDEYQPLWMYWPDLSISSALQDTLSSLLEKMGYLGRAESWVEASFVPMPSNIPEMNVCPVEDEGALPEGDEKIRLLQAMTPSDYGLWRERVKERREAQDLFIKQQKAYEKGKDVSKVKLTKKDLQKIEDALPIGMFEALQLDTADIHKDGWQWPPGSVWVDYRRPKEAMRPRRSYALANRKRVVSPTVARFAVADQVLPRLLEAIEVGGGLHRAFVSYADKMVEGGIIKTIPTVLSGCDGEKNALKGHRHVFILPESSGRQRRGHISHLTLYARMGFDEEARRVLERFSKLSWSERTLQLVLLGVGQPEDFAGFKEEAGQCVLFEESKVWTSVTPFVATRHPKTKKSGAPKCDERGWQIGSPKHDLERLLLAYLREDEPTLCIESIEEEACVMGGKEVAWYKFRTERVRGGGGRRSRASPKGFRVTFSKPVRGPLAVGYGAHFGLGMFRPIDTGDE